jgi:hypothetical protein
VNYIIISESDDKVKTIWTTVKDETGKHFTVKENPSMKINNNVMNSRKLIAYSFNA